MRRRSIPFFTIVLAFLLLGAANDQATILSEDFKDLSRWREVFFSKKPSHTKYTAVTEGGATFLRAQSRASASLLVYKEIFNPYQYPRVRWSWKIDNIIPNADLKTRAGDDLPIRVYIAFAYDPAKADFFERIIYNTLKFIYGEYPPKNSLNYVWSSRVYPEKVIPSPYTKKNMMILLEQGSVKTGTWVKEEVNILEDYRRVFGEDPPSRATIGIMSDTDNTEAEAVSYLTALTVSR